METQKCKAITRAGVRCKNNAKTAGFCHVHLPKPETATFVEKVWAVAEVASTIGGIIGLVEGLVRLWQSLLFGPGPEMPDDYEYLSEQLGPDWNGPSTRYTPRNSNSADVNWTEARRIYDEAVSVLQSPPDDPEELRREITSLDDRASQLIDALPVDLQTMFFERLGDIE
jgi:Family of unknown function (DUF5763)